MSRYQRSADLFQRAQTSLAGGVSSNVRALAWARSILGYNPQYSFDKMVDTALTHQRGESIGQIPN